MKIFSLIIWDACRYDHLSCYGYKKKTSPNLDKVAKKSLIFLNAYTLGTSTPSSLPKLFSANKNAKRISLLNEDNKLVYNLTQLIPPLIRPKLYFVKRVIERFFSNKRKLPKFVKKMKEKFYLVVITANPFYAAIKDWFHEVIFPKDVRYVGVTSYVHPRPLTKEALRIVKEYDEERDLFLVVHYVQPHFPYISPFSKHKFYEKEQIIKALKEGRIDEVIEAYDANIKWVDKESYPLFKKLMKEKAIIIFTSDHGELLGEHGKVTHPDIKDPQFKSWDFYCEELMHVPLIVYNKGKSRIVKEKVFLHNILKSVL